MTNIVWSYTSIQKFETCPYQWYCQYITKEIKFKETEAVIWGREAHEALDKRLKTNEMMSDRFKAYEPYAQAVQRIEGNIYSEHELVVDKEGQQKGWWDKTAFMRGKADVFVDHQDGRGQILDWKTGSIKPSEELEFFTLITFKLYPTIEKIRTAFIWLKHKVKPTVQTYDRDTLSEINSKFFNKIEKIESALAHDKFPKKRSGLCKNYCGSISCEFSGNYQKY